MTEPKKSLGQHWLTDQKSLEAVADAAEIGQGDIVLEIGPGLGALTKILLEQAEKVIAVELDEKLAPKGKLRIEWAERDMPVLAQVKEKFSRSQILKGK